MTSSSFSTPCLNVQSLLEAQWERPEPLTADELAFLNAHAETCVVCAAEIREQQQLIQSLESLPEIPMRDGAAEKMTQGVLDTLVAEMNSSTTSKQPQSTLTPNSTLRYLKPLGWAVAACLIALIFARSPGTNPLAPDTMPNKPSVASVPNQQISPVPASSNEAVMPTTETVNAGHQLAQVKTKRPVYIPSRPPVLESVVAHHKQGKQPPSQSTNQDITPESRVDVAVQTKEISGELLADSMTPDDFILSADAPPVRGVNLDPTVARAMATTQDTDDVALDADKAWSSQGEMSLVDFVGY